MTAWRKPVEHTKHIECDYVAEWINRHSVRHHGSDLTRLLQNAQWRGFAYVSCASNHENSMLWRVMADIVVAVHMAYVAIVVIGFAAILIGSAAQWRWVRNFYFRAAHLAMILLVCAEALVGTNCPFTRLENALRLRGGETGYARDFIGYWLDRLIFYNAPPWVFTAGYLTFGMLVLLTLWLIPVRRPAFLIQMRRY